MTNSKAPRLFEHFADLPDPHLDRQRRRKLFDIASITLCALICGCDSWPDIEEWADIRQDWLKTVLKPPNGIPSHDAFDRGFPRCGPRLMG